MTEYVQRTFAELKTIMVPEKLYMPKKGEGYHAYSKRLAEDCRAGMARLNITQGEVYSYWYTAPGSFAKGPETV